MTTAPVSRQAAARERTPAHAVIPCIEHGPGTQPGPMETSLVALFPQGTETSDVLIRLHVSEERKPARALVACEVHGEFKLDFPFLLGTSRPATGNGGWYEFEFEGGQRPPFKGLEGRVAHLELRDASSDAWVATRTIEGFRTLGPPGPPWSADGAGETHQPWAGLARQICNIALKRTTAVDVLGRLCEWLLKTIPKRGLRYRASRKYHGSGETTLHASLLKRLFDDEPVPAGSTPYFDCQDISMALVALANLVGCGAELKRFGRRRFEDLWASRVWPLGWEAFGPVTPSGVVKMHQVACIRRTGGAEVYGNGDASEPVFDLSMRLDADPQPLLPPHRGVLAAPMASHAFAARLFPAVGAQAELIDGVLGPRTYPGDVKLKEQFRLEVPADLIEGELVDLLAWARNEGIWRDDWELPSLQDFWDLGFRVRRVEAVDRGQLEGLSFDLWPSEAARAVQYLLPDRRQGVHLRVIKKRRAEDLQATFTVTGRSLLELEHRPDDISEVLSRYSGNLPLEVEGPGPALQAAARDLDRRVGARRSFPKMFEEAQKEWLPMAKGIPPASKRLRSSDGRTLLLADESAIVELTLHPL